MIELYNIVALKDLPDYESLKIQIASPVDFHFMFNFFTYFEHEPGLNRPRSILTALFKDYVKRGGNPFTWYKTTAENFLIALKLKSWSFDERSWHIFYFHLESGAKTYRDYKEVKTKKIKDVAKEVVQKMKDGIYDNPFENEDLEQKETIENIVRDHYPKIKNAESFRVIVWNQYYD